MSRRAAQALPSLLIALGVIACLPAGAARPTETPYVFHSPTPEPTPSWHKLQEMYVVKVKEKAQSKDKWDIFDVVMPVPGANESLALIQPTKENPCTMGA